MRKSVDSFAVVIPGEILFARQIMSSPLLIDIAHQVSLLNVLDPDFQLFFGDLTIIITIDFVNNGAERIE